MKAAIKQRKCIYVECALPADNNYYAWQIVVLCLGAAVLLFDASQFTPLTVFLFVTPVLLELFYKKLMPRSLNITRILFIILNSVISFVCFLGIGGFGIVDTGDSFQIVETALVFGGIGIKKASLVFLVLLNLIVPLMFYCGVPNQKTMRTIKDITDKLEGNA